MVPNEKMTEMLFNRYFLQSFRLGQITLYAPSSREEYKRGYDAKLTNSQSFNEVFLQFKRPRLKANQFLISATLHQHRNLQKRPDNSCYYVGHTFRNLKELEQAQTNISSSREFLKYFIMIELSCLDPSLTKIIYERNESSFVPKSVFTKYNHSSSKGSKKERTARISSNKYFTGTAFREAFSRQEVGVHVRLANEGEDFSQDYLSKKLITDKTWCPKLSMINAISAVGSQEGGNRGNFGSIYRMPMG